MHKLAMAVLLLTGVANAEPAPRPKLMFGTPIMIEPAGALDAAGLQRAFETHRNKLLDCYGKELRANGTLQGTVTAQFTIDGKGAVSASMASGLKNKSVESCMADVIKRIGFPRPKTGGDVAVSYPMTLLPEAESKIAFFDDKNRKKLDQIIDRNRQTKLSKFSGIRADPPAKGSPPAGRDDGTGGSPGTGPGGTVPSGTGPGGTGPGGTQPSGAGSDGTGPRAVRITFEEPSGDFGGLTVEEINRVIRARAGIFRACYQRQLNYTPGIGGKLVVHFVVDADGTVQAARTVISSRSTMHNDVVEHCVAINVNHLKFPSRSGVAAIDYPLVFSQGS